MIEYEDNLCVKLEACKRNSTYLTQLLFDVRYLNQFIIDNQFIS